MWLKMNDIAGITRSVIRDHSSNVRRTCNKRTPRSSNKELNRWSQLRTDR
jgi:hypothetical protein